MLRLEAPPGGVTGGSAAPLILCSLLGCAEEEVRRARTCKPDPAGAEPCTSLSVNVSASEPGDVPTKSQAAQTMFGGITSPFALTWWCSATVRGCDTKYRAAHTMCTQ